MWSVLMANKVVHETEVVIEMTGLFINVAQDKLLVILSTSNLIIYSVKD